MPEATFGKRFDQARGRPAGFDFLRLGLACSIFLFHAISVPNADNPQAMAPLRPLTGLPVPMFFALSGFLVAGSAERVRSLPVFLGLRAIRILPALAFEVFLSALLLGPIFTTLTLQSYFSNPMFWRYLLNVVGLVHYRLPGVFLDNPDSRVNAQLWTVPFEVECYVILSILLLFRIQARRRHMLLLFAIVQILWGSAMLYRDFISHTQFVDRFVMLCFFAGGLLYFWRDRLPSSGWLAALCAAFTVGASCYPPLHYFVPLPVAYLTIFLGLSDPPRPALLRGGDYSYGLYLFGYPIQQAVQALGDWSHHWWVNLLVAGPATVLLAFISWHLIEKPTLMKRGMLMRFEQRRPNRRCDPTVSATTST